MLTTLELAKKLGVHRETVRRMARIGKIPFIKCGYRSYRFDYVEVKKSLTKR